MKLYALFQMAYPDIRMQGEPGPPTWLIGIYTVREQAEAAASLIPDQDCVILSEVEANTDLGHQFRIA